MIHFAAGAGDGPATEPYPSASQRPSFPLKVGLHRGTGMSFASMPLYTGDYIRDTRHLTPMRHGVYLLLLMHCWDQKSPIPLDEQEAAGIANARSADEIEGLRYVLNRYFVRMDDGWYNKRIMEEVAKWEKVSQARREGGYEKARRMRDKVRSAVRRAQAVHKQNTSSADAVVDQVSPSPSPSLSSTQKKKDSVSTDVDTGADAPEKSPAEEPMTPKQELWAAGKSILMQSGMPKAQCGAFVGRLVKEYGELAVMEAVRSTVVERPADPASFIVAACRTQSGSRITEKTKKRARDDSVLGMLIGGSRPQPMKDITNDCPPAIPMD